MARLMQAGNADPISPTGMRAKNHRPVTQGGFTYLVVLLSLALASLALLKTGELWSFSQQRQQEQQLHEAGNTLRAAIKAYYESSPGTLKQYPPDLTALLQDKRYLSMRRYLRRIPVDPLTGNADWILINAPQGGIMGVRSNSNKATIILDPLAARQSNLGNRQFVYQASP